MAEGIEFKLIIEPFTRFIDDRQARMRRTAMWTVREGGRFLGKEARRRAPVLKDRNVISVRQARQNGKQGSGPVRGLLRASIRSSRTMKEAGGTFSIKVGPRGPRVHLYAGKIEAKEPYMRPAFDETSAAMQSIADRAYSRVWRE